MTFQFTDTWSASYEGIPADNENINLGAARIRDLKGAIRERLDIDHSWSGDANDGKHNQVTLRVSPQAPTLDNTDGALFSEAVSGNTELFYADSSARVFQLTKAGALNVAPPFPAGTRMVFAQAAAPPGWVQDAILNDALLRVVNDGSGGGAGGSWGISGLNANTTVQGHALSNAELPSHTHQVNATTAVGGNISFGNASPFVQLGQFSITTDGGTGGNQPHVHGAVTTVFGDGTWRPTYVNIIICFKT